MTSDELNQLIAIGYEQRGVEFKAPGSRGDAHLFALVAKAAMAMSNLRDGGLIVIGIAEQSGALAPMGLDSPDLASWNFDDVSAGLNAYSDPYVSVFLETVTLGSANLIVLQIAEFDDVPVLCKKACDPVLRRGACYVRTRRMPETTEVASQTEFRELLDLAIEKGVRRFVSKAHGAGLVLPTSPAEDRRFDEELVEF